MQAKDGADRIPAPAVTEQIKRKSVERLLPLRPAKHAVQIDQFYRAVRGEEALEISAEEALRGKTLDEVDVTTMAGGARWAIQTILETYPKCRVFVCTPIQTGSVEHNGQNLQKIDILRKLCQALSVQLIDCYGESGICEKFEQPSSRGKYLRDGLHPDVEGQVLMGRYIAKEIRNNYF